MYSSMAESTLKNGILDGNHQRERRLGMHFSFEVQSAKCQSRNSADPRCRPGGPGRLVATVPNPTQLRFPSVAPTTLTMPEAAASAAACIASPGPRKPV